MLDLSEILGVYRGQRESLDRPQPLAGGLPEPVGTPCRFLKSRSIWQEILGLINKSSCEDLQKELPIESGSYGCCGTSSQGRYPSGFSFIGALVTPLTLLIHPLTKTEKQVETVIRPNIHIPRQLATFTDSCAEPFFQRQALLRKEVRSSIGIGALIGATAIYGAGSSRIQKLP